MKDAYYFSHDNNASSDPKIQEMLTVYGAQGYGWFWILIELLHQQTSHRLKINGDLSQKIYARQCWIDDSEKISEFIHDCVERFVDENGGLFESDGEYFWSNRLQRDIKKRNEMRETRSKAGRIGGLASGKTNVKQTSSKAKAKRKQSELGKERKGKEIRVKEIPSNSVVNVAETSPKTAIANRPIYHIIESAFLSQAPQIGELVEFNFKREGPHIKELEKKALARDGPEEFAKTVIVVFWRLIHSDDQFWKHQPFLPSVLNSGGIWPRVLKEMENHQEEQLDDRLQEIIGGLKF